MRKPDQYKIKYKHRIFIVFVIYALLLIFTINFVIDVNLHGCFIYSISMESRLCDIFMSLLGFFPLIVFSLQLYENYIQLKLEGDSLKIKRFFTKPYSIHKNNIIIERKKEEEGSNLKKRANRFFIVRDRSNPNVKIKISECYVRNYEEILKYCQLEICSDTL